MLIILLFFLEGQILWCQNIVFDLLKTAGYHVARCITGVDIEISAWSWYI